MSASPISKSASVFPSLFPCVYSSSAVELFSRRLISAISTISAHGSAISAPVAAGSAVATISTAVAAIATELGLGVRSRRTGGEGGECDEESHEEGEAGTKHAVAGGGGCCLAGRLKQECEVWVGGAAICSRPTVVKEAVPREGYQITSIR
jgi:hypothetical protein